LARRDGGNADVAHHGDDGREHVEALIRLNGGRRYRETGSISDIDATLADSPGLTGKEFPLADIGYAPYITRLDHLQLQFLWDKRPHIPDWYDRLRERHGYTEAFEKWFNANYSR
jgi:glutathione S-transferase